MAGEISRVIRFEPTGPIFGVLVIFAGLIVVGATDFMPVRVVGGLVLLVGFYFILFRSFRRLTVEEMVRNDYASWDDIPLPVDGQAILKLLTVWDWTRVAKQAFSDGQTARADQAYQQSELKAKTCSDWLTLENAYREAERPAEADQAMQRAEQSAASDSDRANCQARRMENSGS